VIEEGQAFEKMLNLVDRLIEKVLDTGWTTAATPAKPGFFFTVPDEDWRAKVKTGTGLRLDIYLYEVRESREFRRAHWDNIELADHTSVLSQPPAYFDCHYLISAWSPAEDSEAISPVLDEHEVLSEALRVLMRNPDVTPAVIGVTGGGPVFQQAHVYLTVTPPETPRVLNDFWSTMKLPWRPAIQLVVTAPLDLLKDSPPAPLVTTFIQRYALATLDAANVLVATGAPDEFIQIGGWVLRNDNAAPIRDAIVTRVATGEQFKTDAQGRYTFAGLRRGIHRLRAEAAGMTAIERDLDIPAGPPEDHIFKLS
jgi:uncharacterized protein DUF4255/carboxypeptidase family protein